MRPREQRDDSHETVAQICLFTLLVIVVSFGLLLGAFFWFAGRSDDSDYIDDVLSGFASPELSHALTAGRRHRSDDSAPPLSLYTAPHSHDSSFFSVRVGLVFFTAAEAAPLLGHRARRVVTLSRLPASLVHFHVVGTIDCNDVTASLAGFDALIFNGEAADWRSFCATRHSNDDSPFDEQAMRALLPTTTTTTTTTTTAVTVLYSSLPPPLAPALRIVADSAQLSAAFDTSLLYYPRSFWAFQQPLLSTAAAPVAERLTVAVVDCSGGSPGAGHWLQRLTAALGSRGVHVTAVAFDAADDALQQRPLVETLSAYPVVVVVDQVLCEGYASKWLFPLLADPRRVLAYLGSPRAHFVFHNSPRLLDIRHFPDPDTLAGHLVHCHNDSSPTPVDVYGHRNEEVGLPPLHFYLHDAVDDLAAVLAWRRLLDPLPAVGALPARLSDTCSEHEPFFDRFAASAFDFAQRPDGIDVLIVHAGDPFEDPPGHMAWRGPSACLHAGLRSCTLTSNTSSLPVADAVLLHERLADRADQLPAAPWQPVVGYSAESPVYDYLPWQARRAERFALLVGLHPQPEHAASFSYLWAPQRATAGLPPASAEPAPAGDIFWAASHCVGWRDDLVASIMNHASVDSFGACVNSAGRDDRSEQRYLRYRLYLAVENSVCLDYVTEKLWTPLLWGVLPLYYGAPNVLDYSPTTHAIVPLASFDSAAHLGQFVAWLLAPHNRDAYDYFVGQHLAKAKLRVGFAYHVFTTQPPCDRLYQACNVVADYYTQIVAARTERRPFVGQTVRPDRSCLRTDSPPVFRRPH